MLRTSLDTRVAGEAGINKDEFITVGQIVGGNGLSVRRPIQDEDLPFASIIFDRFSVKIELELSADNKTLFGNILTEKVISLVGTMIYDGILSINGVQYSNEYNNLSYDQPTLFRLKLEQSDFTIEWLNVGFTLDSTDKVYWKI